MSVCRRLAVIGLAFHFIIYAAGIPMVTFLCGSGDQKMVCMMDDCDPSASASHDVTVASPDCCTPSVSQSGVKPALVKDAGSSAKHMTFTEHIGPVDAPVQTVSAMTVSVKTSHTPLFVLNHSLLI